MGDNRRTTYTISEAARELGISAEWLRVGEKRGFFPAALRDHNGHRYYTEEDLERMRKGRGQGGRQSRHLGPCDDRKPE
jgi:MerR HTH family regulatory protein